MNKVIVTDPPRANAEEAAALAKFGVATVHEALGRTGLLGPDLRPIQDGARIGGTAVTALCWPGDNLMIHAAVEQCRPGDVLVVTTTSPSRDGLFGELFATALQHRGVRGLIINTGVRDVADLRAMNFPVWAAAVSAQGTVKATAGSVNVPVVIGGQTIRPGDAILADDDGVMVVPRTSVAEGIRAAQAREDKETATREAFRGGELGLDRYGLREKLADLGVRYVTAEEYEKLERE
ncbi:4-carboxy-4-hydroxy-2-oxoadipate aldolase/oxaloacetate decarboxylase [Amycolatopsis thermophila]|uniref:Putative 4-hydroxy-4-methyl-2-oxoglutarate aldolase n=1 Tax=Amycolatopsis thermophila TaxID=206084 RepID=A0ABU0F6F8_9PSEU|nr:4-carboxy-4-hydroxy-2-oxoadipate aldolase/oxaloacetate decarboxylase [Amycolatopsis thermophila]MDQ0383171.1 4-hydroxy-4-methyl-2-oxoglutarate aldolase [Amycolatopsis thermophila]